MKHGHTWRREKCELPQETAAQILSNALLAAGREENTVPLEALISYSNYRRERYALQRSVIVVILLLFLLLPLLFFAARVEIAPLTAGDKNPVYGISVETKIPIRQVQVTMGGRSVPIYEEEPGVYTISPQENGEMAVKVTLLNHQRTLASVQVESVDTEIPRLLSTEFDSEYVKLYVTDDESGIDYKGIEVRAQSGETSAPDKTDWESGCIMIAYPQEALSVRIPDGRGMCLQSS